MANTQKKISLSMVAAILFAITALFYILVDVVSFLTNLLYLFSNINFNVVTIITSTLSFLFKFVFYALPIVVLAFMCFKKKCNIFLAIPVAVLVIKYITFVLNTNFAYYSGSEQASCILCLLSLILLAFIIIVKAVGQSESVKTLAKGASVLIILMFAIGKILGCLDVMEYFTYILRRLEYVSFENPTIIIRLLQLLWSFWGTLFSIGAIGCFSWWVAKGDVLGLSKPKQVAQNTSETVSVQEGNNAEVVSADAQVVATEEQVAENKANTQTASVNENKAEDDVCIPIKKHVLLLLFTCGIWMFVWMFRFAKNLNKWQNDNTKDPKMQIILSIFVPFYMYYFMYTSAKRYNEVAKARGVELDIAKTTLLLMIFFPIGAPAFVQYKINELFGDATTNDINFGAKKESEQAQTVVEDNSTEQVQEGETKSSTSSFKDKFNSAVSKAGQVAESVVTAVENEIKPTEQVQESEQKSSGSSFKDKFNSAVSKAGQVADSVVTAVENELKPTEQVQEGEQKSSTSSFKDKFNSAVSKAGQVAESVVTAVENEIKAVVNDKAEEVAKEEIKPIEEVTVEEEIKPVVEEVKEEIKPIVSEEVKEEIKEEVKPVSKAVDSNLSIVDQLKQYHQLLKEGIITQEEFDTKKKELLKL